MTQKQKTQVLASLSCIVYLVNVLIAGNAFAATSTITITSTPFLSFSDVPDSFLIDEIDVPLSSTELTSDEDGNLPTARHLTISDTRSCGGLNLQIQADAFTPVSTRLLPDNIRVVTSTNDQLSETVVGNVEYLSGFVGTPDNPTVQNIVAPLNTASTTFSDPSIYTAVSDNDLSVARDLMQGNLTAPAGRNGEMHVSVSYYLLVPQLIAPGTYYTTFTYSLSDDTSGICP